MMADETASVTQTDLRTTTTEDSGNADRALTPYESLFGRLDIYTAAEDLTAENVIEEVNSALSYHFMNVADEDLLYWYRRGLQPVLYRTKDRNEFVLNKIVENHAAEVVEFKDGFFLQQEAFYSSRRPGKKSKVDKLNEYLYRSGKQKVDNILADWFHTVGKAALFVKANDSRDVPLTAYAVDPRCAFVVYSLKPGNEPVYAVNIVVDNDTAKMDVFTKTKVFRLTGSAVPKDSTIFKSVVTTASTIESEEGNVLGHIPIIEYRYNSVNMGAFEQVVGLFNGINTLRSNQIDGVEQFIQSIAVAVNAQFEEGTTANKIKEAGMVSLTSTDGQKADFKILAEELNQEQTEILVDSIYEQALRICCMPSTTKGGTSTSDTGSAVLFRDGWEQAGAAARNTSDLFKESNRYFDEILTDVLRRMGLLDISMIDFELNFIRNETANIQSKAQAAQTMLAMGLHPELALKKSGISNDPVSDVKMSEKYLKMIWGDPEAADKAEASGNGQGEAVIVEEDRDNGENEAGIV